MRCFFFREAEIPSDKKESKHKRKRQRAMVIAHLRDQITSNSETIQCENVEQERKTAFLQRRNSVPAHNNESEESKQNKKTTEKLTVSEPSMTNNDTNNTDKIATKRKHHLSQQDTVDKTKQELLSQNHKMFSKLANLRRKNQKLMKDMANAENEKALMIEEMDVLKYQLKTLKNEITNLEERLKQKKLQIANKIIQTEQIDEKKPDIVQQILSDGVFLRKYCRRGQSHFKKVSIDVENGFIDHESGKYLLKNLQQIQKGPTSHEFVKYSNKIQGSPDTCFTLIFPEKSLNLQAPSRLFLRQFFNVIVNVTKQHRQDALNVLGSPVPAY